MIRVLVVDDSMVQQELLTHILNSDPDINVIATAINGEEGIRLANTLKPDVITMDIHMPKMDGIEATRKIMSTNPIPIVIISGTNSKNEISETFKAFEAGAVAVIDKINFVTSTKNEILKTVKLMSEVKLVKRRDFGAVKLKKSEFDSFSKKAEKRDCALIAIGASTGGPLVLQDIFCRFPETFPPVLVVQHISPGFLDGFAEWLTKTTKRTVKEAVRGEILQKSKIYLAPDAFHMGIDDNHCIMLEKGEVECGHKPSVNYLFRSVAHHMGKKAVGILLTGMGRDGADGLKSMREAGAYTIAQDEASSIIYGMPKEAVLIDGVCETLSPERIGEFVSERLRVVVD